MAETRYYLTEADVELLRELRREHDAGDNAPRPRFRRKPLPFVHAADGGQCYIGLAATAINGFNGSTYSKGYYYFGKLSDPTSPTYIVEESTTDATKKVEAWNVTEMKQLSGKPALIWKQPDGTYFAYPFYREDPWVRVANGGFFSSGVCDVFSGSDSQSGLVTTVTAIGGKNKVVFDRSFHGMVHGVMRGSVAADSGSATLAGIAYLTMSWVNIASTNMDSTYNWALIKSKNGGGGSAFTYPFTYRVRLLSGAYLDSVTISVTGDVAIGDLSNLTFELTAFSNIGWNTNNGFGT